MEYITLTTIEKKPVKVYVKDFKRIVEIENYTLVITKGMNFKVTEKPKEIECMLRSAIQNAPAELAKYNIKIS